MPRFEDANLIRVFDFYLAVMCLFSFLRRFAVYRDGLLVLVAARGRWPKLLGRMGEHRTLVLNWPTLRPVALAFALTALQMMMSRLIWPRASLTVRDVEEGAWRAAVLLAALLPMAAVDVYFLLRVGRFDRVETEKYFDQAEKWVGTWRARAIRVATLGRIDPNRMVDDELRKGLTSLGQTVSWSAWWVSVQVGLRMLFGLTIWLVWAFL